jgi:GDP-D-mannose dehydratase
MRPALITGNSGQDGSYLAALKELQPKCRFYFAGSSEMFGKVRETHSVEEFCSLAFAEVGLDYRDYVRIDERFLRPAEVEVLTGDSSRARQVLSWEPRQSFPGLVKKMVNSDLARLKGTPLPDGTGA